MTAFQFRLEKVLAWRRTQLEVEDAKLRRQIAALAELDRARAELEATAIRSEVQVRDWNPLAGQDLAALSNFHLHIRNREKDLAERRRDAVQQLDAQQQALLVARRRCRLLERLEQRRLTEWQAAADREVEQLAAESYLSGLMRRRA
jgi:hypothetical protein